MDMKLLTLILVVALGFVLSTLPKIPFESDVNFLELNYQINLRRKSFYFASAWVEVAGPMPTISMVSPSALEPSKCI